MQTLPLITHPTLGATIAWHQGKAISVEKFLADVEYLASILPSGKHILNLCRDRYHFTVGLAAAIVSNKISVLPPTHTPEMVRQLLAFSADVFCLHDHGDCSIALPQLRYPTMPERRGIKITVPQISAQQLIAIVFTSGSTGTPIPHSKSWGSLVSNVQAQAERLGLLGNTLYNIVGTIPPQHMYGLESTVLLPMQSGNALSSAHPFYPADICNALQAIPAPRILVSTPLHLRLLLEAELLEAELLEAELLEAELLEAELLDAEPINAELKVPQLALTLSATAPLSPQLAHKIEKNLKTPLMEIYGSTETGQIATRHTTQTAAWQLLPGVELTQPDEQTWASGGHIDTASQLNDIIELIDADSFLLHGRQQDLINIAGKRSSLANLNHHLNAIEGVIDGAFFMPDELSHDHVTRLGACVVAPGLTAAAVLAALRLHIDPVFLPRPLLFVESLPRNATGKLPREALKKLFAASTHKDLSSIQG